MIPDHKVTEIHFVVDEFFKEFDKIIKEHSLQDNRTNKRNRKFTMSESALMLLHDRIMLRKRALIESINNELKNLCQIEYTRHRSFDNFIVNMLSALAAYSFLDKKPSINILEDIVDMNKLIVA